MGVLIVKMTSNAHQNGDVISKWEIAENFKTKMIDCGLYYNGLERECGLNECFATSWMSK